MADPILEIDAAGSNVDGSNPGSALVISTGNYGLLALDSPAPPVKVQWASSIDTEGSLAASAGHENRTVTITLDVTGATALNALTGKIGKLHREGGTLKHTGKSGTVVIADIPATGDYAPAYDLQRLLGDITTVQFTLPALPYLRVAEADLGDNVETTLPALIFSEASIPGDVSGLGRWVIDNDATADWWSVVWGAETDALYAHTTSSGSGALFYEAESRTVLGGAATAVGPTGASGAGSNVVRHTSLTNTEQAILSTQATGGGAHLTHVGSFRVLAHVQVPLTNTGNVSIRLAWSVGDSPITTRNSAVTIADLSHGTLSPVWRTLDLGAVTIAKTSGAHRWEGRVLAASTVTGDDIDIDYLVLVPTGVGYGIASAVPVFQDPTVFSARDEFDQVAGALAAKVLPVGGTWAGAGDADDFTVNATSHTAQRTAVSDATGGGVDLGRFALAGVTTYTNIYVQVTGQYTAPNPAPLTATWGVFARYTDLNNYLAAYVMPDSDVIFLVKKVAGTLNSLSGAEITSIHPATLEKRLRLQVDDQGRAFVWFGDPAVGAGAPLLSAQHDDLATGGTLATGRIGFLDWKDSSSTSTRTYDGFLAAVPVKDAAVYASQSLEIRHNGVERENSAGTAWSRLSSYTGSYLRVPPAGAEGRSVRFIAKPCRNDPGTMPDTAIDDISGRVFNQARYLTFPD